MADPGDDDFTPFAPIEATVEEMTGRLAGGVDGLPAIGQLRFTDANGLVIEAVSGPPDGGERRTAEFVAEIPAAVFSGCPICLDPAPLSDEHVPSRKLGGKIMVNTCVTCNNGLGSRLEATLTHWFDGALPGAIFSSDAVRGRRKSSPILRLATADGQFVLLPQAGHDTGVREILASGQFTLEFSPPDLRTVQYAALKSAYLAACNFLGHLPQSDSANRIRRDLVIARTTPLRDELPASADAERMRLYKTFRPPTERPLALMRAPHQGNDPQEFLVSLAGTVLVSWPFSDLSPVVPR
jgi:hypothetical protein